MSEQRMRKVPERCGLSIAQCGLSLFDAIVFHNRVAHGDAFVADVGSGVIAWAGDQLCNKALSFVAEGTTEGVVFPKTAHRLFTQDTGFGPIDLGIRSSSTIRA